MGRQFIDRNEELRILNERILSNKAEFVVIYGRRRVGKTELMREFMKKQKGIRFLARTESEKDQLTRLSISLAEYFKDEFIAKNPLQTWDAFFTYLLRYASERLIVAFDEFPWLVDSSKALPSIIQDYWDNKLKDSKLFLILCGSSMSMMTKEVLGSKSPLYGRRTAQLKIEPLKFKSFVKFFSKYNIEELIELYAVIGGTPGYINEIIDGENIFTVIKTKFLQRDQFLFEDAEFILKEELKEPKFYFSILKSIANGNTQLGQIMNDTGLPKGIVSKYISVLSDLNFVRREISVTDKETSRKGIYLISDNYLRFWFKFIYPNLEHTEENEPDFVVAQKIKPYFNSFVSLAFENICKEFLKTKLKFDKLGKWWDKNAEIDLVAIGKETKNITFIECKWQENVNALSIYHQMKEKAKLVNWHATSRNEHFIILAKSFTNKPSQKDLTLFEKEDFAKMFK